MYLENNKLFQRKVNKRQSVVSFFKLFAYFNENNVLFTASVFTIVWWIRSDQLKITRDDYRSATKWFPAMLFIIRLLAILHPCRFCYNDDFENELNIGFIDSERMEVNKSRKHFFFAASFALLHDGMTFNIINKIKSSTMLIIYMYNVKTGNLKKMTRSIPRGGQIS